MRTASTFLIGMIALCMVQTTFVVHVHAEEVTRAEYEAAYDYYCLDDSYSMYEEAGMTSAQELASYCEAVDEYLNPALVEEEEYEWQRTADVTVEMNVRTDGSAEVTERILYDFGDVARQGIFRHIDTTSPIKVLSVVNEHGVAYPYSTQRTNGGLFSLAQETIITIGDTKKLVKGKKTYILTYIVRDSVKRFADYDEVHWTTNNKWDVSTTNAQITITLPRHIAKGDIRVSCQYGVTDDTEHCDDKVIYPNDGQEVNQLKVAIDQLPAYEVLTVNVQFPKGIVAEPPFVTAALQALEKYFLVLIAILLLMLWRRKDLAYWLRRKNYYRTHVIVPEYDPGDHDPLEASVILNGVISDTMVSAEIIDLAKRGYLVIKKVDDEFVFESTGKDQSALPEYDRRLVDRLAGRRQSDLIDTFGPIVEQVKELAFRSLVVRKYVDSNGIASSVEKRVVSVVLPFFFALNPGVFIWFLAGPRIGFVFSVFCVLVGITSIIFRPRINRLTIKGLDAERQLLGLKKYIALAEAERMAFHHDSQNDSKLFEQLLPFAMVFGLEKNWSKQFEGMYTVVSAGLSDDGAETTLSTAEFSARVNTLYALTTEAIAASKSLQKSQHQESGEEFLQKGSKSK